MPVYPTFLSTKATILTSSGSLSMRIPLRLAMICLFVAFLKSMASLGQTGMHAPQPVQTKGLILAFPSSMVMALTGQTGTQRPLPSHISVITKAFSGLVVMYSPLRKREALAAAPKASETVSRTSFGLRAHPHAKTPVTRESTGSSFGCFSCMNPSSPKDNFILPASFLSPEGGIMGVARATRSNSSSLTSFIMVSSATRTSLPLFFFQISATLPRMKATPASWSRQ